MNMRIGRDQQRCFLPDSWQILVSGLGRVEVENFVVADDVYVCVL